MQVDDTFVHAIDLVRYIRQQYGDYFCIGVAGTSKLRDMKQRSGISNQRWMATYDER